MGRLDPVERAWTLIFLALAVVALSFAAAWISSPAGPPFWGIGEPESQWGEAGHYTGSTYHPGTKSVAAPASWFAPGLIHPSTPSTASPGNPPTDCISARRPQPNGCSPAYVELHALKQRIVVTHAIAAAIVILVGPAFIVRHVRERRAVPPSS